MTGGEAAMLEITALTKTYPGPTGPVVALSDVSLSVARGEFLAIQGPSGCGKSTLLLAAGALLAPSGGNVTVCGANPYALGHERRSAFRAENIGFVFQQFFLVPYLSVLENVLVPSLAREDHRSDAMERARLLVQRFGLAHRSDHKPRELSVGERQRTALARAMLNAPGILLADEPTGNLDADNEEIVLSHLRRFARDGGSVLMVTHSERAAGYADRAVHLADGALCSR